MDGVEKPVKIQYFFFVILADCSVTFLTEKPNISPVVERRTFFPEDFHAYFYYIFQVARDCGL